LADGTLDCVATDHAPHAEQEKDGEFDLAPFGMVGLETALGVSHRAMIESGTWDWPDLIDRLTRRPAEAFRLEAGTLTSGQPADVTIFDPQATWTVTPKTLTSKSKNSPYFGWTLTGVVQTTLVSGRKVYQRDGIN